MEQEQTTEPQAAEYQIVDSHGMTIAQWEALKAQYAAAGYQYAPGLLVFRRAEQQAPLSLVPENEEQERETQ